MNEIQVYDNKAMIEVADNYLAETKGITLPQNYDYKNAVSMLYLQCVSLTTSDGTPALEVCTPDSIRRTVQEMVTKGLNPAKKQCYAIPYAVKDKDTKKVIRWELQLQESYFGKQKRAYTDNQDVVPNSIHAQCIYKGDNFEYAIIDGRKVVTKHEQKFENIKDENIIGAYATAKLKDGTTISDVMTATEIKRSWAMSRSGGAVHSNFSHEMACKTVKSRLAKHLSNITDDGSLLGEEEPQNRFENVSINPNMIEDAEVSEVPTNVNDDGVVEEVETLNDEPIPEAKSTPEEKPTKNYCADCNAFITEKVATYSKKAYGRPLCFKCQDKQEK